MRVDLFLPSCERSIGQANRRVEGKHDSMCATVIDCVRSVSHGNTASTHAW